MVPQQPKPASESGRPAADRPFVDREEPIATFKAALKEPQRTKPFVLVFHGGAGTGKSRLRCELVRQLASGADVVTATLDFDVPVHRQPDAALLYLRNALREAYQVTFPSLDLAYAVLWQKSHPDKPLGDDLKPLLEPGSLLSQLIDETGKLPLIGLVPRIIVLVGKSPEPPNPRTLEPFYSEWWERRGERELEDLPQMEPAAIVEQLPKLWASDLKDWLGAASLKPQATSNESGKKQESESYHQDTKAQSDHGLISEGENQKSATRDLAGPGRWTMNGERGTRRAVLFIDSYEKLWETGSTEADFFKRDAWVRELVKQLPETLWVISGRQKLRWEEAEREWADVLRQHELGPLPEHSARQFLSGCGITDEPTQEAIAKGSQGLPHYLNLAVDTFMEIKESSQRAGLVQSLFSEAESSDSPAQLFAQFIRHLDQPEITTLQILSASRFWNYGLFEHLVTEYQTGYPLTGYDDLSRFSFVGEGAAPETRTMHDLMREALQEHQAPELRRRVHLFLHEYYAKQLDGLDVKSITDRHKAALTEAFYHGRQAKSASELWTWFQVAHDFFAGQWQMLASLGREMAKALEAELGPDHADTATGLGQLAADLVWTDEYEEAEQLLRRSLAIAEAGQGPKHVHYPGFLNELAIVLHKQGRFEEAEVVGRRMVKLLEDRPNCDAADRAQALDVLANALMLQSKHAEAEELLRREIAVCEAELGPDHHQTMRAVSSLGRLFAEQGRSSESMALTRRVLAAKERKCGPNHPDVAALTDGLAVGLYCLGRYAEAEPLFRRSLKINEESLGPDNAETAVNRHNLASLLYSMGRYAEAEPLRRRALAAHEKKRGPDHLYTIRMTIGLFGDLLEQGKYLEAERIALSALANSEKKLGQYNQETANALVMAGRVYSAQDRHAEAEGYLRRALDTRTRILGPDHPQTMGTLTPLALNEERRGRYAEAESIYRDLLERRGRTQGPEHPDVARTASLLAEVCCRDGRYAEAEALYRRAQAIREKVFGPDHHFVAEVLDSLAKVCEQTGRAAEAQELSARAKAIRDKNAEAVQAQAPSPI
jgi:tetratricopeptide (TPR) repeat protein